MPRPCRMRQSATGNHYEHLIAGRWESLPADERTQEQRDKDRDENLRAMYPNLFTERKEK